MQDKYSYRDASLSDYVAVLRRRKSLFLLAVVLVPLVAALASFAQTRVYEASAQVILGGERLAEVVNGLPNSSLSGDADRVAQTQVDIARVDTVASRTLSALRLRDRTADDFLANSRVIAKSNADVLVFTAADSNSRRAIRLANEYARQFTIYRAQLDSGPVTRALREVRSKIAELNTRDGSALLIESLRAKERQLETLQAVQFSSARVLRTASSATQVRPRPLFNVLFGIIVGIVLGAAIAFVRDATDTRVRSVKDVLEAVDLPVLGLVPELPTGSEAGKRLVMLHEPDGAAAEAFRMLRTKLDLANLTHHAQVIMFTSAVESDGKSTVVSNLSVALARGGRRVVLVDFDLRRSSILQLFDLRSRRGLTTVALKTGTMDDALVRVDLADDSLERRIRTSTDGSGNDSGATRSSSPADRHGDLLILPAGPLPANVGEFVETQAVREIFDDLRTRSDFVLVDAPPLSVSDAIALATVVDAIVVVTSVRVARRPILSELEQTLATLPAIKLGLVITDVGLDEHVYGGYTPYPGRVFELEVEPPPQVIRAADNLETTTGIDEVAAPQGRWQRQA